METRKTRKTQKSQKTQESQEPQETQEPQKTQETQETQEVQKIQENVSAVRPYGIFTETIREVLGFIRKELILRGILFLLLGVLMIARPVQTMLTVTIAVGVVILLDALLMLIPVLKYHGKGKILLLLNVAILILLGVFTCISPLTANIIWIVLIGVWQLLSGLHCLCFWKTAGGTAIFAGISGVIAGLVLIMMPLAGWLALMWLMGILSVACGIFAILLGIRLKRV